MSPCLLRAMTVALVGAALAAGCGRPEQVTKTRQLVAEGPSGPAAVRVAAMPEEHPASGGLAWTLPEGWREVSGTAIRIADFRLGPRGEAECYIAVLPGDGGGLGANVNRWRSQMGAPPADDDGIEGLPEVVVLGRPATVVEAVGDYTDMRGEVLAGAMLLGAICPLPDRTLFVKMTGPEDVVREERQRFLDFCRSIDHEDARPVEDSP